VGSGTIYDQAEVAANLNLGAKVHGAAWLGSNLFTVIENGAALVLRKYDEAYQQVGELPLSASDAQLFNISEGLLLVSNQNGRAQISILGNDLSESYAAAQLAVYLPTIGRSGVFLDDFSSASNWPVYQDSQVNLGTINGEYRIQSNQSGYLNAIVSSYPRAENYEVEMDARFETRGQGLGFILDVMGSFDRFYLVELRPDLRSVP
jgi:hypothetical protein